MTAPNGTLDSDFETTQFTEQDADDELVVLYTAALVNGKYEIQSVVAADSITATPTGYKAGDNLKADGTTYKYSALPYNEITKADVDAEDDVVIYLDSYGYAIYIDSDTSNSDDYAYVEAVEQANGQFTTGKYVAKIVLGNGKGETTIVNLDEDFTDAQTKAQVNVTEAYDGKIVTYSTNKDGEYTFKTVSTDRDVTASGVDLSITRGKATMTLKAATTDPQAAAKTVTANSKTVFFVQDDDEYDVYVGIANVPSIKGVAGTSVTVVAESNIAKAVFISDAKASGSTNKDDVIVVAFDASAKTEYNADDGEYYVYNVINAGNVETMKFAANVNLVSDKTADAIVVLNSVTYDKDSADLVTDVDIADTSDDVYTGTGTEKAKDGVLKLGTEYKSYDSKVVVYKVDSDCKISASTISGVKTDANDKVTFIVDDDDIVTNIYILEVKNAD